MMPYNTFDDCVEGRGGGGEGIEGKHVLGDWNIKKPQSREICDGIDEGCAITQKVPT